MASGWIRRLGRFAVVAAMVLASAVAVVVWRPKATKLRKPRPDNMVGQPAPRIADDIEEWIQGRELELRKLKGKAVLLFFWHPRDEGKSQPWIPRVVKLAQEFEDKGLVTVGVCVVDREDAQALVQPLISQYEIPFRMALDCDADLHFAYVIDKEKKGTPYCYLLRRESQKWMIAWGSHPEFLTESVIEQALAGK